MSLDKFEIKRIAGIAYLQTRIRQLGAMYNYVTIDGMVGNDTKTAWREILEIALGLNRPFPMPVFDSNSIAYIQSSIRDAFKLKPDYAKPSFTVDGQWGDDTKAAIDTVIDMYADRVIVRSCTRVSQPTGRLSDRTLSGMRTKLKPYNGQRPRPTQYADDQGKHIEGFHWFENLPHEQNQDVWNLLAKAMNFDNPVVSPAHMAAAGYVIGIHWFQGMPVGIIVWRTAHTLELRARGENCSEFGDSRVAYLAGIYVNRSIQGQGIGTGMLVKSRNHMADLGYAELRFTKEGRNEEIENRLFRTLTCGLRYVPYDPMNNLGNESETHCRHKL